jgi:hypothetical protein
MVRVYVQKDLGPWKLIKLEELETYKEARRKEKFYKSGLGRQELKKLFDK